jgi:hypothetical protein
VIIKSTDMCQAQVVTDEAAGEYELQFVHIDSDEIICRWRAPFGTGRAHAIERILAYAGPDDIDALCEHLKAGLQ